MAHADAHGDEGVASACFTKGTCCREGEAGTRHSEGMAHGNGSSVGVNARIEIVKAERARYSQGLGGEGFVELNMVDVCHGQSGTLQGELGGGHGADSHDAGLNAGDSARDDASKGRERVGAKARFRGNEQGRSAVVKA